MPAGGGTTLGDEDPAAVPDAAEELTVSEAARRAGVSVATLRRWQRDGLLPDTDGRMTPAVAAQARIVARLRGRGHSLAALRQAAASGQLAFGYVEELFGGGPGPVSLRRAASRVGLEPALVQRLFRTMGFPDRDQLGARDVDFLRRVADVLDAGLPLVALLQLVRVYGQALAQMADAEVRLFHLYVHEPLMRDGVDGLEIAEEMEGLARDLMPLVPPIMGYVHQRYLAHFLEQDVIGHVEGDAGGDEDSGRLLGRLRVAIAFADLAGYTRMTEEQGDEEAVNAVERFIEAVTETLPEDARLVKTIGDEVMVVASDASTLVDWAVGFQLLYAHRPLARIGVHVGTTLYREGDYYGSEVNLTARVVARAAGGEVLVTRPVVEASGAHLEFDRIGEVRLKGFSAPTELFLARLADE